MDVLSPKNFRGPIFMGVPPLTNNTTKTPDGEDLVKICAAINCWAVGSKQEQRQQKRECVLKHKTSPSLSHETAPSNHEIFYINIINWKTDSCQIRVRVQAPGTRRQWTEATWRHMTSLAASSDDAVLRTWIVDVTVDDAWRRVDSSRCPIDAWVIDVHVARRDVINHVTGGQWRQNTTRRMMILLTVVSWVVINAKTTAKNVGK